MCASSSASGLSGSSGGPGGGGCTPPADAGQASASCGSGHALATVSAADTGRPDTVTAPPAPADTWTPPQPSGWPHPDTVAGCGGQHGPTRRPRPCGTPRPSARLLATVSGPHAGTSTAWRLSPLSCSAARSAMPTPIGRRPGVARSHRLEQARSGCLSVPSRPVLLGRQRAGRAAGPTVGRGR
jgi:hypothetical protein